MKVCDLALFSESTSSGVRTYIESKIDYVRHRPYLDHVVIVPGAKASIRMHGRSKVIVVRGVRSPYPGVRLGLNLFEVAALIKGERPDVIEVNCQYTLAWAAFLATRRRRTPVIGVYHTDVPACLRHWVRRTGSLVASAVERLAEFYEGLIYRRCTVTVLLNAAMANRVARMGVHRTRLLPCGVDPDTFHPNRRSAAFRDDLGIGPNQTILFYAGRLSPEKELDVLFAAFERLPGGGQYVLVLAGDGPQAASVARYADTHPWVRYLGHLSSRDELATAYASADLFVAPGRYETFGMSTAEALCSGLPIVGIEDSGTAALITPQTGIATRAGDAASMADAISAVASWRPDTTRDACHRFASAQFAWDRVFDRYVAMYHELLAPAAAERSA
ncbi:MAG: hypothetical protein DMF87_19835 [Acidobacteria bacterium]|nr:MAG: hypothetical protein DMF87_19835 [Acidobacteriota bacterium]